MSKLILNTDCELYEKSGLALYSTRQVADDFKKKHKHVLEAYDTMFLLSQETDDDDLAGPKNRLSYTFMLENFFEHKYKDASGRMSREVLMTRSGASVMVMGFTGKKALKFKIILMKRFDQMEKFILSLNSARMEYPALTEAIYNAHDEPKHYHFSNEADMINRIVLGVNAKKFREEHSIKKGESIRPYLTTEQICNIEALQRVDIGLIVAGMEFQERKAVLSNYINRLMLKQAA